jgi:serine phosphatase RsbU (regulator of sigma subunit)
VNDARGLRVVPIDKPTFTIGRGRGCDLVLEDSEVSRDHAEIASTGAGWVLRDHKSRHGTFLNGDRVTERVLSHRDQIECGRGGPALVFLVGDGEATADGSKHVAAGELRQMAALLESLRAMGSERVLDEVLALVLDAAITASGAERGFIMLADRHGRLEMSVAREAGGHAAPVGGFGTSRKIPEEVFETGQLRVVADLLEGDLPETHTQTIAFGIRHVLCAPLRLVRYVEQSRTPEARANIGVLYLDSRVRGRLLSTAAQAAIEALATEAANAIESARLYAEALEKARLDEELTTASRIQQELLPEPRRAGPFYEAVGASLPSRMIGGDFFDYLDMAGGAFAFALGDVTGKGPPAALVTAVVQGILGAHAGTGIEPADLVALVNRVLLSRRTETRYVTLFLAVLGQDGRLAYCNAGQNPPFLLTRHGLVKLETGGTLVGAFPEAIYEQGSEQLAEGDTVVLFSDGVVEALDAADQEFGEERVRATIEPLRGSPPQAILDALLVALQAFTRDVPWRDDLTAVVVRYSRAT